jgi:acyl-CoA synthetase (AMP-forming)/AMP-acid ligase II
MKSESGPIRPSLLTRIAFHVDRTSTKRAYSKLNSRAEVVDYYTYEDLQRKLVGISQVLDVSEGWVLLLFQNSFEFLPYFLACLHKGTIPSTQEIPNSSYKMDKLLGKIQKYGIAKVIVQQEVYHKKWFQKLLDQVPEEYRSRFVEAPQPSDLSGAFLDTTLPDTDIAFVQFTSGTTNHAKALGITHDNLFYAIESLGGRVGRTADSISINWLPHYHDLGLIDGLLAGLYWGSSGYLMESNDFIANPLAWLDAMSRYRITHSSAPNFAYDLCVDRFRGKEIKGLDLSCLNSLLLGGEMVRLSTLERFLEQFKPYGLNEKSLLPGYGMAEATLAVSCQSALSLKYTKRDDGYQVVSCGAIFEGSRVEIVNTEGELLGENEIGTIILTGQGVAKRFRNGQFEDVAIVKTGDIGFLSNNQLYLLGREGDIMIRNGQNYALSEIEEIISTVHEAIHASGVVALLTQKNDGIENFELVVELKRSVWEEEDHQAVVNAVRKVLSRSLGLFPDCITLVGYWNIPRTSSGKKQKQKLKDGLSRSDIQPIFVS